MDVIFCRNVIIYFEKETQERLVNQLCTHLLKDGFLFVGHSETLHGMTVPLVQTAPMVYRKAH
jgi:chemotaxis protein methyltransferase CheR